ncbi:potassium transporter Kup [Reyranella sp.]|uniref:potassium transporter Kup n=1 Tax=Reyranella sp. TaxID=1929291 RepID=UPI003BADA191
MTAATRPASKRRSAGLTLAALGVVFGDIGTSPLYTVQTCFSDYTGLQPTPDNVLGILSMITWALIIVVTVKYVGVVMRADNHGEGGVLALMALVSGAPRRRRRVYVVLAIAGAALFYGDCLLTPAISVLSAVEGLNVATPDFSPVVLPIAVGVLTALFAIQRFGTSGIGNWFGPIMFLWFILLFVLGIRHVLEHPQVLAALSPLHAAEFALRHQTLAFVALGAVTLALTGAEALYADLGHFGRGPIRAAWALVVLPALLTNYYGQGALLLADPTAIANPFFRLAPDWALYPLVVVATLATVIASQATISGAFSMAQQATLLGLSPRARIQHTSASESGQIYVPAVNWLQLAGVIAVVLAFQSSSNIASAYGIAVTGTMLITTVLVLALAIRLWKWPLVLVVPLFLVLLTVDGALFSANLLKFTHGGWVPLVIALALFACMTTWYRGRQAVDRREKERSVPIDRLLETVEPDKVFRPRGTAVYLTTYSDYGSNCLMQNLTHNGVLHEHVVLLTVQWAGDPFIAPAARLQVNEIGSGIYRALLCYGFMEQPQVARDLAPIADHGVPLDPAHTSWFIGHNNVVSGEKPLLPILQRKLFLVLVRFAASAGDFLGLPANRTVELGIRIEV